MQVRALTPEDASAFQALRLRGLRECPAAFASSFEEESATPIVEIERRLLPRPDAAILGAFDDPTLLALVGIQRESMAKMAHKAFVWGMYVAPEGRGRGVGAELLKYPLEYAGTTLRVRQVNLGVNTKNAAAVALYRKLGFKEFGLEREFLQVNGEFQDEYQMVCRVASAA